MAVVARSRTRPETAPREIMFSHPVVGGPREGRSYGMPVFTDGTPTKVWPYNTGSVLIGYTACEYMHTRTKARLFHAGTDIAPAGCHAWQFRGGEFRYLGKFDSKNRALSQIERAYEQSRAVPSSPVQPVAARSRVRPLK